MRDVSFEYEFLREDERTETWTVYGFVEPGHPPSRVSSCATPYPGRGPLACVQHVEYDTGALVPYERWEDLEEVFRIRLIREAQGDETWA